MSTFFTIPGKRKRSSTTDGPKKRLATSIAKGPAKTVKPLPKQRRERDESISGSDSESGGAGGEEEFNGSGSDSEGEEETAAEKRLRLAERYLDTTRKQLDDLVGFNAEDVDRDLIAERLKEDVSEAKGKVYRLLADELDFGKASHTMFRCDTLTTTSVTICAPYCYTVSKDLCLIQWKLQDIPANQYPQTTKKKPKRQAPPRKKPAKINIVKGNKNKSKEKGYQGHTGEILCVRASSDGKFVVTGGADRRLIIHDAKTLKPLKVFNHHRDAVTGLAFRRGTNQLYSSSKDRTVKVWSLDELAYVETLFGHQDQVLDIDALAQERCISVGARDKTARLWKVAEETQLVFRGGAIDKKRMPDVDPRSMAHEGSMDRVAMIDEELFVSGSDNGTIALWHIQKKKPVFVLQQAHGLDPPLDPSEASAEEIPDPKLVPPPQPRWITALRTVPYTDLILSGSWDGHVRVWKLSDDKKRIEPAGILGVPSTRDSPEFNGVSEDSDDHPKVNGTRFESQPSWSVKGIINDISVCERGERGKDGLCVVIAVGKEHRLGNWKKVPGSKNGAYVFEVPRIDRTAVPNGDETKSGEGF